MAIPKMRGKKVDGRVHFREVKREIVFVRLAPDGNKEKATTWVALHGEGIRLRFVGSTSQGPLHRNQREVLEESGPLPATVDSLLGHRPSGGGEIRIRACSAIVQPESAEVLDGIRRHSRLVGYLEAGAPKGYLLIKQQSNPSNFVQRHRELGFKVNLLHS